MDETPNLKLPYILPSQAQKHVTHNEALRMLDAIVHLGVKSWSLGDAPSSPAEGDRYIVAAQASGAWAGKDGMIASFIDGGWLFVIPATGWLAYVADEALLLVFDGSLWKNSSSVPDELSLSMLGVQATPDAVNRFALSSDASLFNNAGAGHQVKVNKQAASDTASLLFQTNWTGYAEMGLNGSNDFSVKVGDDGGNWREALRVDRATGNVAIGSNWPKTRLDVDGPIRPASYSVATLPSAASHGAGAIIFVTDSGTGAEMAYSDGNAWRSMRSGSLIS
ncbi:hypothetical protein C086_00484 [Brucella abortus F6/05-3]|uniref:DUF2793 domain-containing protein n=1 Tax=Brucella abortus TaxID=235 RepID=UPI0001B4A78D|nr:DUF2793 domain-containing protein [Brucella abortus]AIJ53869.1 hypothetical protein DK51_931 [Brucella abortus]AIJ77483.1 hypothetical protein DO75_1488 [Brucella abortus]EEX82001.1 conserved hypothetical protein [Brucella abortus bv. 3 str. Tulya]ENP36372.1 hypothetical protein C088_00443 [Brucella abortus 65/110]ENP42796.1 hypothetical protein C055_00382 [Brucella abortus 78/36]